MQWLLVSFKPCYSSLTIPPSFTRHDEVASDPRPPHRCSGPPGSGAGGVAGDLQPDGTELMRKSNTDVSAAHRRLLQQAQGAAAVLLPVQAESQPERLHKLRQQQESFQVMRRSDPSMLIK